MKIGKAKPHMTLPNGDKIYEGGFARTSDGRKVGPMGRYCEGYWHIGSGPTDEHSYLWDDYGKGQDNVDLVAEWTDEPETQPETGTLAELNVKPGDVVTFGAGSRLAMITGPQQGSYFPATWGDPQEATMISNEGLTPWRIAFRAPQPEAPKLWRDMSPEEKGALLLAHHEGEVIEWTRCPGDIEFKRNSKSGGRPIWDDRHAYRIRPEPKLETERVTIVNADGMVIGRGTIITENGSPDPASIRMEPMK